MKKDKEYTQEQYDKLLGKFDSMLGSHPKKPFKEWILDKSKEESD